MGNREIRMDQRVSTPVIRPVSVQRPNALIWKPVGEGDRLSFANSSFQAVHKVLLEVFGAFPISLSAKSHLPHLKAMRAASGGVAAYNDLVVALEKYGEIEVREGN